MPQIKPTRGIRLSKTHPLARGLVGYLPFNEGTGKIVSDLSGNNNTGIEQVDSVWQPGKFGVARYFSGDDYIIINNGAVAGDVLDLTSNFAIVVGFSTNTPASASYDTMVGKRLDVGNYQWQFRLLNGKLNFLATGGSVLALTTLVAKQSYQGVVRYDGNIEIYLDGKLDCVPAAKSITHKNTNVYIGCNEYGVSLVSHFWNGLVEYVYFYNRVLLTFEIALLARKPFCMFEAWNISRISSVVANGFVEIAGSLAALSFLTDSADLRRARGIAGGVTAQSSLSGSIKVSRKISGTIAATSSLSGSLSLVGEVSRSRGSGFKPIEGAERLRGLRRSAFY